MSYLIDTDIASAFLKGNGQVFNRFIQHSGGLYISAVSAAELYAWTLRPRAPIGRLRGLQDLFTDVPLVHVDHDVAHRAGEIQATLLDRRSPMPGMDLLIAGTALLHNLTLTTHNVQDYQNVPGLRIEDWLSA